MLFTLLYIQALVALSVKCSPEDKMTWMNSGALKKVGLFNKNLKKTAKEVVVS